MASIVRERERADMHTVDVHLAVGLSLVRILQIRLKIDIMKMDVCRHLIPNDDG